MILLSFAAPRRRRSGPAGERSYVAAAACDRGSATNRPVLTGHSSVAGRSCVYAARSTICVVPRPVQRALSNECSMISSTCTLSVRPSLASKTVSLDWSCERRTNVNSHFVRAQEIRHQVPLFVVQCFTLVQETGFDRKPGRRVRRRLQPHSPALPHDHRFRVTDLVRPRERPLDRDDGHRGCRAVRQAPSLPHSRPRYH